MLGMVRAVLAGATDEYPGCKYLFSLLRVFCCPCNLNLQVQVQVYVQVLVQGQVQVHLALGAHSLVIKIVVIKCLRPYLCCSHAEVGLPGV